MQYRDGKKGILILLSNIWLVLPAVVKQQQKEISRNHVPSLFAISVLFDDTQPVSLIYGHDAHCTIPAPLLLTKGGKSDHKRKALHSDLGLDTECLAGNVIMGRMGRIDQFDPFGPLFYFLCDILRPHPVRVASALMRGPPVATRMG